MLLDLAVAIALGGDCLTDLVVVRTQPDLFEHVTSYTTVSPLIAPLAIAAPPTLVGLRAARAAAPGSGSGSCTPGSPTTAMS